MGLVLIAEHEETSQLIISSSTTALGHSHVFVTNCDAVRVLIRENPHIELLVIDLMLPGDAMSLLDELREDPELKSVSVIAISGKVSLTQIEKVLMHGALYFTPRPIHTRSLKHYISRCLGQGPVFSRATEYQPFGG